MKKFAFLLALVAVFAMSATAFALEDLQISEVASLLPLSTDNSAIFAENNGGIVGNTTNLYYSEADGKNTQNPTIAFRYLSTPFRTAIVADKDDDNSVVVLVNGSLVISGDAGFQAISADGAGKAASVGSADQGQVKFSDIVINAKDLTSLSNIAIVSSELANGAVVPASIDKAKAKVSLAINPVKVGITASQYVIVLTSGDELPKTEISLDFNIPGAAGAAISTDGANRYDVKFGSDFITGNGTSQDSGLRASYNSKDKVVTIDSVTKDGVTKTGIFPVTVVTSDDTVVDESFNGGKKGIKVLSNDSSVTLATIDVVVFPEATRTATVAAGTLSFAEGNAERSVVIQTDLVAGGVSDDLGTDGKGYVFIENSKTAYTLGEGQYLPVTVSKRQAGTTTGFYYDIEIPKATLDTLKTDAKKLYVTTAADFAGGMKITNALDLNITSGGQPTPPAPTEATATMTSATEVSELPGTVVLPLGSNIDPESISQFGTHKYTLTLSYNDADGEKPTSARLYIEPVVYSGNKNLGIVVVKTDGSLVLYPSTYAATRLTTNALVPFDGSLKAASVGDLSAAAVQSLGTIEAYIVEYETVEDKPYTGGGSSGGCEMGFGLAAVAGLAALVLRKRSK